MRKMSCEGLNDQAKVAQIDRTGNEFQLSHFLIQLSLLFSFVWLNQACNWFGFFFFFFTDLIMSLN